MRMAPTKYKGILNDLGLSLYWNKKTQKETGGVSSTSAWILNKNGDISIVSKKQAKRYKFFLVFLDFLKICLIYTEATIGMVTLKH